MNLPENIKYFEQRAIRIQNVSILEEYVNRNFDKILQFIDTGNCYHQPQNGKLIQSDLYIFEKEVRKYGSVEKYFMCDKILFDILSEMHVPNLHYNPLMDNYLLKMFKVEGGWGMSLDLCSFQSMCESCYTGAEKNCILKNVLKE